MKVFTAPEKCEVKDDEISVFLAGGISKCPDWQTDVIAQLANGDLAGKLVVFNPRRANFEVGKKEDTRIQIEWEFAQLEKMDIFSMYFCDSESVQPICMYELGRNIARMQARFPNDWEDRIVVSIEKGYSRKDDVLEQLILACNKKDKINVMSNYDLLRSYHVESILRAYSKILYV